MSKLPEKKKKQKQTQSPQMAVSPSIGLIQLNQMKNPLVRCLSLSLESWNLFPITDENLSYQPADSVACQAKEDFLTTG